MRFRTRVAIQVATASRDSVGGVIYGEPYTSPAGLESLPATIMPLVDEERQERITPDEERWVIVVGGDHRDITNSMFVLNGSDRFEIERVGWTIGRKVTTLNARRITL